MKEAETFIFKEAEVGGDQLFGLANSVRSKSRLFH